MPRAKGEHLILAMGKVLNLAQLAGKLEDYSRQVQRVAQPRMVAPHE
jgi:hypothetical protein